MRGAHLIKHWSVTQSTPTLTSAEAELGGICRGSSISLGLVALARDLGFTWDLTIQTDATAAIGICRRRGLGRVRHLAVADLWLQDRLRSGDFELCKVLGSNNVADLLTKYLDRSTQDRHCESLGLDFEAGRADSAAHISVLVPASKLAHNYDERESLCCHVLYG